MKTGSRPAVAAVLLCVGPERWLRTQAIERILRICISPGFEEMDRVQFAEPPQDPQAILEALRTPPFGSGRRVVVVEGLTGIGKDSLPWFASYLAHPSDTGCLVLCTERIEAAEIPFLRRNPSLLQISWCQPLKGASLKAWIVDQAKAAGKGIDPEAVHLLITRCGTGLPELALAVESLTLLVGSASRIARNHVEALVAPSARETVFDLLERALAGEPQVAVEMLRQALGSGRLTVEQLFGALGWYYRAHPMRWSRERLQGALEELLEADAQLKQGHPSPELLADQLLLKLGS